MDTQPNEPSPAGGVRERARVAVMADLTDIATRHLAEQGAGQLSLRAIARELGMVSSAVYRYVASRDDLLTLLIQRSYNTVGTLAEQADRSTAAAGGSPADRWLAVARAVRTWARSVPQEYALIYGSPVPGYRAPAETVESAVRIWRVIAGVMQDAVADGSLRVPVRSFEVEGLLTPEVAALVDGVPGPPYQDVVARSLTLFSSLIGTISAEIFGHFVGFGTDQDRVFDVTIATAAAGVGLDLPV